jgi:hypothetical protein
MPGKKTMAFIGVVGSLIIGAAYVTTQLVSTMMGGP